MHERRRALAEYYARRAAEYEQVYAKPERQGDLRRLESMLSESFRGLDVLEVACGTGYWTQCVALSARSILAVDFNGEVLDIARHKDFAGCRVDFARADAYTLEGVSTGYSAGLVAFWWSHVARVEVPRFLCTLHARLVVGAPVIVMDNRYVQGSSTPISRRDNHGNTFQIRKLADGSEHEVLKNFPDAMTFAALLDGFGEDLEFTESRYYWIAKYRVKAMFDRESSG